MYKYYKQVFDSEHYLLQKEVAAISGFVSTGNNPHTQMIGAALKEYVENHKVDSMLYYSTLHKAMLNVYPRIVYQPVLEELYRKIGPNLRGSIEIGGKKYAYALTHKAMFGGAA